MEELIEKALQGDKEALISLFYSYGVDETTVPDGALRERLTGLFEPLLDNLSERERHYGKIVASQPERGDAYDDTAQSSYTGSCSERNYECEYSVSERLLKQ